MILEGKIVVISGGAGLIGMQFAKAIISQGGKVIVTDLNKKKINAFNKKLKQIYPNQMFDTYQLDITSETSIKKLIDYVSSKYKKIDAFVNCSYPRNKNYGKDFLRVKYNDVAENLSMNLGSCIISSQLFSLYFKKQGYGNIINISSIYGVVAPKFELYNKTSLTVPVEYAVIKSGLIHFTKYLAKYLKRQNIRVNTISPGGIFDHQPKNFVNKYNSNCLNKGMLNQKDLDGTLIFLISDDSKYINGQNIIVDDGFTL